MSHYIVVRSTLFSVGFTDLATRLKRICDYPYELTGGSGLYRITVGSETECTRLERSLGRMTDLEIVAVDAPYDGIEESA